MICHGNFYLLILFFPIAKFKLDQSIIMQIMFYSIERSERKQIVSDSRVRIEHDKYLVARPQKKQRIELLRIERSSQSLENNILHIFARRNPQTVSHIVRQLL